MDFSRNAPMNELQASDLDERVGLLSHFENWQDASAVQEK
jgi:hypothetical protein